MAKPLRANKESIRRVAATKQKERQMRTTNIVKAAGALALAIGLSALNASAGQGNQGNPGVIPPQASSHGQTYGEWSAAWWQWVLSVPADHNPALDLRGADAAQGQSGPVQGGRASSRAQISRGRGSD